MNKLRWYVLMLISAIVVVLEVIPLSRGRSLHCYGGMAEYRTRMQVSGMPFGFLSMNRTGNNCYAVVNGKDQFSKDPFKYGNYFFSPASFWFDLIIAGGIIIGSYALLDRRKLTA